jgi:hypothetical protein
VSFIAIYAGFVILVSTTSAHDQIDDRLLSPVAVHLSLLGACALGLLLEPAGDRKHTLLARSVAAVMVAGMLVWPAARAGRATLRAARSGIGLAGLEWKKSETARYLAAHQAELGAAAIYSNAPDAVYILTELRTIWSPAGVEYNASGPRRDVRKLRGSWPREKEATLAWFSGRKLDALFTVDELRTIASVEEVANLNDGSIFAVRPTAPAR